MNHITDSTISKVYRETLGMADKHRPHGWRSSFKTLALDFGSFGEDVVALALDHAHGSQVDRAYDRGERWAERVRLMRWWDEQLSPPEGNDNVLPLRPVGAA